MVELMKNRKLFWILLVILFIPVFIFLLSIYQTYIGGGYRYIQGRHDDWHIEKDGKRVINGAVLALQAKSGIAFGLRLPAEYLNCSGGYEIRLKHENVYFILNTNNGNISEFDSRDAFENELKSLKLFTKIRLDYSQFDLMWDKYSKYYEGVNYNSCTEVESMRVFRETK